MYVLANGESALWHGARPGRLWHLLVAMYSEKPLVSFVTPFYNTDAYLEQCIESVLAQNYENWEYILVNNGSTDKSVEIAQRYESQHRVKIRLHHNPEFLSQVQNYNRALKFISAESRYCKIVQADDWLFPGCIGRMVEVGEAHPSVGIVGAYELEGDKVSLDGLPYPSQEVAGREVCRLYFLKHRYLFGTPTSLLMRSDLVRSRNPFYEERYAPFEDGHACFDLLRKCNFGFVHQVLTYTRRQPESIISPLLGFGLEQFLHLSMLVVHGRDYLNDQEYIQCLNRAERRYFLYLCKVALGLQRNGSDFWDFHKRGLSAVNYSLDWRALSRWVPRALLEKSWEAFWRRWDHET